MIKKDDLPQNLIPLEIWPRCFSGVFDILPISLVSLVIYLYFSQKTTFLFSDFKGSSEFVNVIAGLRYMAVVNLAYVIIYGLFEATSGASWGLKKNNGIIVMQSGVIADEMTLFWRYLAYSPLTFVYAFCLFLSPDTAFKFASSIVNPLFWIIFAYSVIDFVVWYRSDCHLHIVDIYFKTIIVDRKVYESSLLSDTKTVPSSASASTFPSGDSESSRVPVNPTAVKSLDPVRPTRPIKSKSMAVESDTEQSDLLNKIYSVVSSEITAGQFDEPLLLRAEIESDGDEKLKMRIYTKLRVEKYLSAQKKAS